MSYLYKKLLQYWSIILTFLPECSPAGLEYVGVWNKFVSPALLYSFVLMTVFGLFVICGKCVWRCNNKKI